MPQIVWEGNKKEWGLPHNGEPLHENAVRIKTAENVFRCSVELETEEVGAVHIDTDDDIIFLMKNRYFNEICGYILLFYCRCISDFILSGTDKKQVTEKSGIKIYEN